MEEYNVQLKKEFYNDPSNWIIYRGRDSISGLRFEVMFKDHNLWMVEGHLDNNKNKVCEKFKCPPDLYKKMTEGRKGFRKGYIHADKINLDKPETINVDEIFQEMDNKNLKGKVSVGGPVYTSLPEEMDYLISGFPKNKKYVILENARLDKFDIYFSNWEEVIKFRDMERKLEDKVDPMFM